MNGRTLWKASFKNNMQLRKAGQERPPLSTRDSPVVPTYIFNNAKGEVEICGSEDALQ